jgi:hypothetical protein
MATSRRRREAKKRLKQQRLRQQKLTHRRKRWLIFLRGIYAVCVAIFSWIAFLLLFYPPRVSVNPIGSEKPGDPIRAEFEIANNSTFSIHDVSGQSVFGGRYGETAWSQNFVPLQPTIPKIEPGSRPAQMMATFARVGLLTQSDFLDVEVVIRFRPSFVWWHYVIKRRFLARRLPDDSMKWIEITTQ